MDLSLLNQDRILFIAMVSAALITLVLSKQTKKWYKTRFPYHLGGSLLVGTIAWWWLQRTFFQDIIPLSLIEWVLLPVFTISILFTIKRVRAWYIVAIISAVIATLLATLLANQYYQYYPNIKDLLSLNHEQSPTGQAAIFRSQPVATTPRTPPLLSEATYTPPSDQPTHGQLNSIVIPGAQSGFQARQEFVYLPPAALAANNNVKLPVVILLAGVPGNPGDWTVHLGLAEVLDAFAAQHKGLAPIAVVADQTGGNGFTDTACVNSPRGNVETYLTKDVPAFIQQHYNVRTESNAWAIGGISDGAMCSQVLGLRHPDIFGTILSFSGATAPNAGSRQQTLATFFNGSAAEYQAHDAQAILQTTDAKQRLAKSSVWLSIGRDEQQSLIQANRSVFDLAKAIGMDVTLELPAGHHSFGLWRQSFVRSVPWLSYHLGLTSCDQSCGH